MNESIEQQLKHLEEQLESSIEHQKREGIFENEANIRFEKNFLAFQKYYPSIAEHISSFHCREDFCIHVTKSGHGNFFPEGESVPLYDDEPLKQAKEQVDNYTKKANFSRTNYFSNSHWESDDERIHVQYMLKLTEQLSKVKDMKSKRLDSLPDIFPSCLIFGIGLGYHIPELLKRHSFDYLFICEPDLEMFYASLFCIDWFSIIEKVDKEGGCLFLHLGISYEDFFNEIFKISEDIGAFSVINSFCYQHYPSDEINNLIKAFFDNYYQLHQGFGFYNDAITGLAHSIRNVEQGAAFLYANQKAQQSLKDIPVFVVGNGPSLDEAIEVIRQYQEDVIIIAGGTAFQSLIKAGIKADFHVLVERPKITYDIQKKIAPESGYKDVNLLAVDVMYPDVIGLYKWAGLGLKGPEAGSAFLSMASMRYYGRGITALPACGPLVSNTALSYAITMGFKQIYLFGVDNGYPLSGETHSKLSIYNDTQLKSAFKPLAGASIKLEGNFGDDVLAAPLLALSKTTFDRLVNSATMCDVYNIGAGAKIRGAIPLHSEDVFVQSNNLNREEVVDLIKAQHFKNIELNDIEQLVGLDEFNSLCDYLIDIGNREFSSREEAHELLKAQQRLVYAYRKSAHPHLFHIIKGTLLYFHCPLLTLLYFFEDEQETLEQFKNVFDLWLKFLKEIQKDFPINWKTKCNWSKPEYQD
ncbi:MULTISPECIES: 6-hydroxymethylpterin diphosphokinase MptE-like protein [Pseudoalteromonas]|uniref:motility associated factor glycosyltransferase family protein n=1 Tax=Pseudoalteromonas TaxID=53246 RepID=UPI0013FE2E26|nr:MULTISPECIES: 6-hydroxymethylpterin diphosphokinase MptE-like protein [Pseudoalteromonas]|tara:strand:- start:9584 stop:11671 length:2088 start_codon:yes stop_codon:yes gene_type:complete